MAPNPSPLVVWLATGRRRRGLRLAGSLAAVLAFLLMVGPGVAAAPVAAPEDGRLPGPLAGTTIHPAALSPRAAERMLGAPPLDAPASTGGLRDLGLWGTTVDGPFGRTAVVFHVYNTPRHTWLTITELRTQLPLKDSPWDLMMAQPTTLAGRPAKLFEQLSEITVSWQESPTFQVSVSEDSQLQRGPRGPADPMLRPILDDDAFLQLAAAVHPHGLTLGPLHLELPW